MDERLHWMTLRRFYTTQKVRLPSFGESDKANLEQFKRAERAGASSSQAVRFALYLAPRN